MPWRDEYEPKDEGEKKGPRLSLGKKRFGKPLLLIVGLLVGTLLGYGMATWSSTINGPAPKATIQIIPFPVSFVSFTMTNWTTGTATLVLASTGLASGTCTVTFNTTPAASFSVTYSFASQSTGQSYTGSTGTDVSSATTIQLVC